jgi:hypothetical protein
MSYGLISKDCGRSASADQMDAIIMSPILRTFCLDMMRGLLHRKQFSLAGSSLRKIVNKVSKRGLL